MSLKIVKSAMRCALVMPLLLGSALAFAQQDGRFPVYGPVPEPTPVPGVKPVKIDTLDVLKGDGVYHFSGTRIINLRAESAPQGERYKLTETTTDPSEGTFNENIDVGNFVRDGERRPVGHPTFAVPAADGSAILIFQGAAPLRMMVSLQAYDVGGMQIRDFLRNSDNYPRQDAARAGTTVFPEGASAYLVTVRFMDEVLMLPHKESFTGAANTGQFVGNFSRDIPYCLSYEDRKGATPYAMLFKTTGGKKGPVILYPAKLGTLFCARDGVKVIGEGEWEERTVGGTRAIVVKFSPDVNPLDTGVSSVERDAAQIAFVEPTKGTPGVRPGKLYQAGARIMDFQYRFNKTAAEAIRLALGGQ